MDHSVRAIVTAYDDLGRVNLVTSYSTNNSQNWDSSHIVNQINDWYNGWGQLAREYQEHDGSIDTNTPFIAYTYGDGAATDSNVAKYVRLTDVIYPNTPSPRDVSYGYGTTGAIDDIMSRLETIGSTSGSEIDAKYTYLGAGTIVKTAHPQVSDELNLDYGIANNAFGGFDRFGRVVDEVWKNSSGTVLDGYKYGYDRAGDLWWKTNLEPNATDLDELYTYDDLGRLINTQRGELDVTTDPSNPAFTDTPTKTQGWTLDGQGNFSQFDDNGATQTRDVNAANEITSSTGIATPTYDTAGNMISDGTLNYKYDAWNRLVEVTTMVGETERTVAEYKYDGANHRIEKTVYDLSTGDPTATTDYFYNQQWQVVEERMLPAGENQSTVVTQYVWDQSYIDTPVVRFRGSETLYYTTDANHNVTSLVDPAGEVVERYVYDAYGKVTFCGGLWTPLTTGGNNSTTRSGVSSAYVNEVLYCGYRYDPETSLVISTTVATAGNYQDRNRELITTLSTFDVRDPAAADINLYRYCGNNPLNATDPTGWVSIGTTCIVGLYASGQCVSSDGTIKDLYTVCIRCEESHCWIDAKDEHDGTEHTYGRWKQGYGGTTSSGVAIDIEKNQGRHWTNERCTETCGYTPTINSGYGLIGNNCSSYARDEWERISGEHLNAGHIYDSPGTLSDSIKDKNGGKSTGSPGGTGNNDGGSCGCG